MNLILRAKALSLDLELKVKHVRDSAYWGMPEGTPITPGMKPKGSKRPKITGKIPKQHPPFPPNSDGDPHYHRYKRMYDQRTSVPPRDSGDYEGMTAQEMWDDWAADRAKYTAENRNSSTRRKALAVENYTGDGYQYMNGLARYDDVAIADLSSQETMDLLQEIEDMEAVMRPVGKNIVVHRTTTAPIFDQLQPGMQFRDTGFVSTTVLEGYLDEVREDLYSADPYLTQMEIRVPADTEAVYATAFQPKRNRDSDIGEAELVLQRGTEFKVVERNGQNLILEVVVPGTEGATPFDDKLDVYAHEMHKLKVEEENEGDDYDDF